MFVLTVTDEYYDVRVKKITKTREELYAYMRDLEVDEEDYIYELGCTAADRERIIDELSLELEDLVYQIHEYEGDFD